MDFAPEGSYQRGIPYTLIMFDMRVSGVAERFRSERTAWGEFAEVEMLDVHHLVLVVRPGAARRVAT